MNLHQTFKHEAIAEKTALQLCIYFVVLSITIFITFLCPLIPADLQLDIIYVSDTT